MPWTTSRLLRVSVLAAALGSGFTSTARASTITFNDLAAFLGATSGLTTIDFNGIAPVNGFVSYANGPLVLSGVTITSNSSMFVIDPGFYGAPYAGGGFLNTDFSNPNVLTFATTNTALGFNFGGLFGSPVTFTVTLSTGDVFNVVSNTSIINNTTLDFFGAISSAPFTSFTLSMPDSPNYNAVDNLRLGAAATTTVPEPGTLTLFGLGFAAWRLRRKRTNS
jgi:PEP-CTERM motif